MDYSLNEEILEYFFAKIKDSIFPSEKNNYTSKFLQSKLLLFCIVALLAFKVVSILVFVNVPANIFFADITKSSLENFVNQTRQSIGLPKLTENPKLSQAAQLKAQNMIQDNYFSHTSPGGVTPWFWFLKAGYNYKYAGENLAIGFYESEEVFQAWLDSPTHKANIVNSHYTEIGTAVLKGYGGADTVVVVQEFASPLPKQITKANTPKPSSAVVAQPKTPTSPSETVTEEKVLSEETQTDVSVKPTSENASNNLLSKTMNYTLYNSDQLIQNIIYGISLIVIGIMLTLIFFSFNLQLKKQLVFRAIIIIGLLSVATLINKEAVIALIPHQTLI